MTQLERLEERTAKQGLKLTRASLSGASFKIIKPHSEEAIFRGTLNEASFFIQGIEYGRRNVI